MLTGLRFIDKGARDEDPEEDPDRPMFSLMTGKYRRAKRYGDGEFPPLLATGTIANVLHLQSEVQIRKQTQFLHKVLSSAPKKTHYYKYQTTQQVQPFSYLSQYRVAQDEQNITGQFLQNRTYQGLDPRVGQDEPSILEQGRSGIARGYGEVKPA